MIQTIKNWFTKTVATFKKYAMLLLVSLGLIAGGAALAQTKNFGWSNPTANTDGSIYDAATEQAESRIYCDIDPASFVPESPGNPQTESPSVVTPGAVTAAVKDFLPGRYSCFATVVSVYGYESTASNLTTFVVTPTVPPRPITDFAVD